MNPNPHITVDDTARSRMRTGTDGLALHRSFTPDTDTPCDNFYCKADPEGIVRKGTDALLSFYYRDGSVLVRHRECE